MNAELKSRVLLHVAQSSRGPVMSSRWVNNIVSKDLIATGVRAKGL